MTLFIFLQALQSQSMIRCLMAKPFFNPIDHPFAFPLHISRPNHEAPGDEKAESQTLSNLISKMRLFQIICPRSPGAGPVFCFMSFLRRCVILPDDAHTHTPTRSHTPNHKFPPRCPTTQSQLTTIFVVNELTLSGAHLESEKPP